jgi:uncharacterized protein YndB with AHSA1/START domain
VTDEPAKRDRQRIELDLEPTTSRLLMSPIEKGDDMSAIVGSAQIARSPEDVFAYATDFSHFPEWQGSVTSVRPEGDAPLAVGSRAVITRRVGPRDLTAPEEVSELNPPRSWSVRAVAGPVTATAKGAIEPLGDPAASQVTISLEFEGHGIGRLLVPLVIRPQARRQLPINLQKLKEILERGA